MAQNVTVQGASYVDVPAVVLPKTGGGTASFTDVTDTTAVAADVASGKYFYTAAGQRTEGTASGGGGGIQIGVQNTPIPNILNMFYALEQGTAKTGTFTPSQALPNTEMEMFDTELTTVNGLFIADESQDVLNTGNTPENALFGFVIDPVSDDTASNDTTGYTYAANRTTTYLQNSKNGGSGRFLNRGAWRVASGVFYYTAPYNRNDNYCAFHSAHTYRWVAW